MMDEKKDKLEQFKCPCCDGAVSFDTKSQKMKCPYCDTELELEALREYQSELTTEAKDEMDWQTEAGGAWSEGEEGGLSTYVCATCGGEIVCDETTSATACPFCDNPVVLKGRLSGSLKPDYVIPFKLDKKAAKQGLLRHYKKRLVPKAFTEENHIDEIKGVYVPVWLFDADADAKIRYKATKVHTWRDSQFEYTRTMHFLLVRGGKIGFAAVPVDGSTKMDDALMESIEPFDLNDAVDFNTAYLSGFFADKYDVDAGESIGRANERIKNTTEAAFDKTVQGYLSATPTDTCIQLKNGVAKYALYPVWLLQTSYEGKKYTFAMNGQTGKMAGNMPVDKKAYTGWLLGLTGLFSALIFALLYLVW